MSRTTCIACISNHITAYRREKIPRKSRQKFDILVLSLSLPHGTDGRKKQNGAQCHTKSHAPEITAGRNDECGDSQLRPRSVPAPAAVSAVRNRIHRHFPLRDQFILEKELKQEPDTGKQTIDTRNVPVTEYAECHCQNQSPDRFPVDYFIHTQKDQGQHIDTIQPHNVAALRNLVLHQPISHGKCDHKYRPDPVLKTTLQKP